MKALVKIAIILSLGTVLMARVMKDYKWDLFFLYWYLAHIYLV
jgi:hypothetical protein